MSDLDRNRTNSAVMDEPLPMSRQRRRGRIAVVGALIAAVLATSVSQYFAREARDHATRGNAPIVVDAGNNLASLNSFTLALLLGGLRGPLVMMLWTSSETQKVEHNLEDLDTKIELIRLLQPEFDSVHIFQVWNKAYNISVQMTSLFNKYTTILDAIDYGQRALKASPNDINLLVAVADVYFNKLGSASEKAYYRGKVRTETLPHKVRARDQADPGWRRVSLDPLLDSSGNFLPQMVEPVRTRPATLAPDEPFNNGAPMQYLASFAPFPYGVSPIAIAYDYYMMAQTLQQTIHVKHAQLSVQVIDSRPAISLQFWADEEREAGRRNEMIAFGVPVPQTTEKLDLELPAADLPLDKPPTDLAKYEEAVYDYGRSAQVAQAALEAFRDHVKRYPGNFFTYESHMDETKGHRLMDLGDQAYLQALTASGSQRDAYSKTARDNFTQAITQMERTMLKFYTDNSLLQQVLPHVTKEQLDTLPDDVIHQAALTSQMAIARGLPDSHLDDRNEFMLYFARISARLQRLGDAMQVPTTQAK